MPTKFNEPGPLAPTIFHEDWWLEIATEGQYNVVEVIDHGQLVARLPYFLTKKLGMSIIDMPPLTHFVGPAVIEGQGKENTKFLRRLDLTRQLLAQLPETSSCYIKCHRDVKEIIPFQIAGFRSSVQFTYEIYPQSVDDAWVNLRDKARNIIRPARSRYTVTHGTDAAQFMKFYGDNIENRGISNNKDSEICVKLVTAALERGRGRILEARDQTGAIASAIFYVWDATSCYYLMTSRAPNSHAGATSLLVWDAICDAMNRNLVFDFDGITSEGAVRSAVAFTPIIAPRYIATRESYAMRVIRLAKALRSERSYFF